MADFLIYISKMFDMPSFITNARISIHFHMFNSYNLLCFASVDFRNVFDVANFRHKTAASVMRTLQEELVKVMRRTEASGQIHASLSTERRLTMEHTKVNVQISHFPFYSSKIKISFVI